MPTSTRNETAAAFAAEWEQWHAAHERRRADPHGFLAVTHRAVNLPCAYTDLATCPLPPAENRLAVAIEAGEQIPHERQAGQ